MLRRLPRLIRILLAAACAPACLAQSLSSHSLAAATLAPSALLAGHLIVLYRSAAVPVVADQLATRAGARVLSHLQHLGISTLAVSAADEPSAIAHLSADPNVALVLHDRYVSAHTPLLRPALRANTTSSNGAPKTASRGLLSRGPIQPRSDTTDSSYNSPQGWAVRQAGGYGANVPGGPSTGPWNASLGAGVRIAVLDSGIDAHHPDIAPNITVNLSEVNQDPTAGLPSPCDDGTPQDQSGHGTWTASLAAGALGPGTGDTVGVAPQATLLNIKVLQRMPAQGVTDPLKACEAGQPGGLLSWVLRGINDAIAQHADVIALSLGSLVDASTGEGAGWKAAFDHATFAATQSGAVIVSALGNDGHNLSAGTLTELPAQARGVLAITAATNPDCAENLTAGATCAPGPISRPYYSNYGATLNAVAVAGGSYPEGALGDTTSAATGWVRGACSTGNPGTSDGLPANSGSFGCFGLGHVSYVQAMGTSASAALAAGAVAILRASRPDLTAAQIVSTLRRSATHTSTLAEPLLNLSAAIALQ